MWTNHVQLHSYGLDDECYVIANAIFIFGYKRATCEQYELADRGVICKLLRPRQQMLLKHALVSTPNVGLLAYQTC